MCNGRHRGTHIHIYLENANSNHIHQKDSAKTKLTKIMLMIDKLSRCIKTVSHNYSNVSNFHGYRQSTYRGFQCAKAHSKKSLFPGMLLALIGGCKCAFSLATRRGKGLAPEESRPNAFPWFAYILINNSNRILILS